MGLTEQIATDQGKVKEIDEWLAEYNGKDEKLIDTKLDRQEACLERISNARNAYVNSQ